MYNKRVQISNLFPLKRNNPHAIFRLRFILERITNIKEDTLKKKKKKR